MVPEPLRAPRPTPSEDPPEIPGFVVDGVIGRGASGVVYRGREVALDREVAIKVLHPEVAKNRRTVQRLQREARTTARLGHPHIVSAVAIGEHGGRHWYAMALVDGPSLAQVLRRDGRLREREALRLFIPLCEALEHLWEHGVVHRDIKPANILIDKAGGAQLADLGLAFADDDPSLTNQGATLGTPHYISPEQAVDPSSADVQSDIWSFGATLYHAVCGRPPFHGDSTAEVLSSVLHARVPDPLRYEPGLSRGLVLCLRKCLTRDVAERYRTPRELLLDLERVRERRAPKVVKSALDPIEREPRPWVRPALIGGAIASALLAVVLIAMQLGGEASPPNDPGAEGNEVPRYLPLDRLAARADADPSDAGRILREVEGLAGTLPAEVLPAWEGLRDRLRGELRTELTAACDRYGALADRHIAAGDFIAARGALAVEMEAELLAATGFTTEELVERYGYYGARRRTLEGRLDEAEAQHLERLSRKVPERVDRILAEAERLRERNRFKSALAALDVDEVQLLEDAGYGGWRFEPERVGDLFEEARVRLAVQRDAVDFAWQGVDQELRAFVERRAERLRESLLLFGEGSVPAAEGLTTAFDNELFERGMLREEMPLSKTSYALDRLRDAQRDLESFEDDQRADAFDEAYRLTLELEESRWRLRDYAAVGALWSELGEDLAQAAGDPSRPWRVARGERVAVRIEEARLLRELLRRASDGVVARDGELREMRVLAGGIVEEGRIQAGLDPLSDGFSLVTERGESFALRLEEIPSRDLLALAGVPEIDSDLTPEDRIGVASFRFHEGELARSKATLDSGPLPEEGAVGALAADLNERIDNRLEAQLASREDRDQRVSDLLLLATEEAVEQSPERALFAVHELLTEYADVPDVRMLRVKLTALRKRLEDRPRTFEEAYQPDELVRGANDSVRMKFAFDGLEEGAWELQDWRFDGSGWAAPDIVAGWDELARRFGARLILRAPLDVSGDVEVVVRFQVTDPKAPPQLLLVSVLGFHTALTGTGLPTAERRSRWHVGVGDLKGFLGEVRRGKGEASPGVLKPGEEQRLVIRVNANRGTVAVELDGVVLGERRFRGRVPEPVSLVLRSWDPVRVSEVEVVGGG